MTNTSWTSRLTLGVVCMGLLSAQAPAPQTSAIGVMASAIVNDEVISSIDVRQRVVLMMVTTGIKPTSADVLKQLESQALRGLIDERLQSQEAKRLKVEVKDTEVEAELAALAKDNGTDVAQLSAQLAQLGGSINSLREQVRAEIAWQRLIAGRYGARVRISKEQVEETQKKLAQAADKSQYLISEIVLESPDMASRGQLQAVAERIYQELNKGASFTTLARQFSTSSSAAAGGDVGWVAAGELSSEIESVIATMQAGQISPPIPTADGMRIVAVRDKRSGEAQRTILSLKQAVVPIRGRGDAPETIKALAKASETLNLLRARITGCGDFTAKAKGVAGISSGEIAKIDQSKLAIEFQNAVQGLEIGQVSAPIRTRIGVHILTVCSRATESGAATPDARNIEMRLQNQQLTLLAKRYLRDLRAAATIEGR